MNTEDKNKFKEIMTMISINYNEEINLPKLKLWWTLFNHYPIQAFEKAVYQHISCPDAGMFSPKIANITKMIQGTTKQNEQNIESEAELAWTSILNAIRGVGSYGTPKFKNPKVAATINAMINWSQLCGCTVSDLDWKKKEFISLYSTITNTELERLPAEIKGRIEMESSKQEEIGEYNGLMKQLEQRKKEVES